MQNPTIDPIDLVVSAATLGALHDTTDTTSALTARAAARADGLGQDILDTMVEVGPFPLVYHWRPVLELSGFTISVPQLLQVEAARRFFADALRPPRTDAARRAYEQLEDLRAAIAEALVDWPLAVDPVTGLSDWRGIEHMPSRWSRSSVSSTAEAAS